MIKVNYNTETTLVEGYYPDAVNYASIPEPFIEIEYDKQINDKQMCVVGGIYQEYVKSDSELLQEAKDYKLTQITPARDAFMYADIEYNGSTFTNSKASGNNITSALAIMGTSINWLDASGNLVVMTKAQLKELGSLILEKRNIGYFQEAAFKTQINTCTTIAEVEAINITF